MFGVGGILEHCVDEIILVAKWFIGVISARFIGVDGLERDSLVFDVVGPGQVVLPLDQGRFVPDVVPYSVREAVSLTRIGARQHGLRLDCFEEFVLVDFAIKLSEHLFALVVT